MKFILKRPKKKKTIDEIASGGGGGGRGRGDKDVEGGGVDVRAADSTLTIVAKVPIREDPYEEGEDVTATVATNESERHNAPKERKETTAAERVRSLSPKNKDLDKILKPVKKKKKKKVSDGGAKKEEITSRKDSDADADKANERNKVKEKKSKEKKMAEVPEEAVKQAQGPTPAENHATAGSSKKKSKKKSSKSKAKKGSDEVASPTAEESNEKEDKKMEKKVKKKRSPSHSRQEKNRGNAASASKEKRGMPKTRPDKVKIKVDRPETLKDKSASPFAKEAPVSSTPRHTTLIATNVKPGDQDKKGERRLSAIKDKTESGVPNHHRGGSSRNSPRIRTSGNGARSPTRSKPDNNNKRSPSKVKPSTGRTRSPSWIRSGAGGRRRVGSGLRVDAGGGVGGLISPRGAGAPSSPGSDASGVSGVTSPMSQRSVKTIRVDNRRKSRPTGTATAGDGELSCISLIQEVSKEEEEMVSVGEAFGLSAGLPTVPSERQASGLTRELSAATGASSAEVLSQRSERSRDLLGEFDPCLCRGPMETRGISREELYQNDARDLAGPDANKSTDTAGDPPLSSVNDNVDVVVDDMLTVATDANPKPGGEMWGCFSCAWDGDREYVDNHKGTLPSAATSKVGESKEGKTKTNESSPAEDDGALDELENALCDETMDDEMVCVGDATYDDTTVGDSTYDNTLDGTLCTTDDDRTQETFPGSSSSASTSYVAKESGTIISDGTSAESSEASSMTFETSVDCSSSESNSSRSSTASSYSTEEDLADDEKSVSEGSSEASSQMGRIRSKSAPASHKPPVASGGKVVPIASASKIQKKRPSTAPVKLEKKRPIIPSPKLDKDRKKSASPSDNKKSGSSSSKLDKESSISTPKKLDKGRSAPTLHKIGKEDKIVAQSKLEKRLSVSRSSKENSISASKKLEKMRSIPASLRLDKKKPSRDTPSPAVMAKEKKVLVEKQSRAPPPPPKSPSPKFERKSMVGEIKAVIARPKSPFASLDQPETIAEDQAPPPPSTTPKINIKIKSAARSRTPSQDLVSSAATSVVPSGPSSVGAADAMKRERSLSPVMVNKKGQRGGSATPTSWKMNSALRSFPAQCDPSPSVPTMTADMISREASSTTRPVVRVNGERTVRSSPSAFGKRAERWRAGSPPLSMGIFDRMVAMREKKSVSTATARDNEEAPSATDTPPPLPRIEPHKEDPNAADSTGREEGLAEAEALKAEMPAAHVKPQAPRCTVIEDGGSTSVEVSVPNEDERREDEEDGGDGLMAFPEVEEAVEGRSEGRDGTEDAQRQPSFEDTHSVGTEALMNQAQELLAQEIAGL